MLPPLGSEYSRWLLYSEIWTLVWLAAWKSSGWPGISFFLHVVYVCGLASSVVVSRQSDLADSFSQSKCSKIMSRSCKTSYDLALEVPECHFCPLQVVNHVIKASQTHGRRFILYLSVGGINTKFKITLICRGRQAHK